MGNVSENQRRIKVQVYFVEQRKHYSNIFLKGTTKSPVRNIAVKMIIKVNLQ